MEETIRCLVANVKELVTKGPSEAKVTERGTKYFSGGTKVYCLPPLWGDGYSQIAVLGRHRGARCLCRMVISRERLENFRFQTTGNPYVIAQIKKCGKDWSSYEETFPN